MANEVEKSVFDILNAVNVNGHTETKKNGKDELTYLSWAWAWTEVKKRFPAAQYEILENANGDHFFPSKYGIEVRTRVTIEGVTHPMWLPVMDGANRALKDEPYTYTVKGWDGKPVTKTVQAATMMDINKAIMRCLTKNLGMFGLGLYIYAGEDLPENVEDEQQPKKDEPKSEPEKKPEQPKANPTEKKAQANPKMKEAWTAFQELESVKSMDANGKKTFFVASITKWTGKKDPRTLTDAEWDTVIGQIDLTKVI